MEKEINIKKSFLVVFHGSFIPLQGVEYIIEAAKLLEGNDIDFEIIGRGQTFKKVSELAQNLNVKNVIFTQKIPYEQLPGYLAKADVCLGIFGDTPKTQRVIPHKVYEAIAMAKPVITADTPATQELFENRKNVLFCRHANPQDLAGKILELKNNADLRERIAAGGYELFKQKATPKIIAKQLLEELKN